MKKRKLISIGPNVVEFDLHDLIQVIIGASIIAVPVIFSQEGWGFLDSLPMINTIMTVVLTLFFISTFTYFHYHKEHLRQNPKYHLGELAKRVFGTYILSFIVVALVLWVTGFLSWGEIFLLGGIKKIVVINLPSALGAAISDTIK